MSGLSRAPEHAVDHGAEPAKQKVLLVGGAGFVGQTIAQHLAAHGFQPIVFDLEVGELHFPGYRGDMMVPQHLREAFAAEKPAGCIHLASWGMSGSAMLSPECLRINIEGTRNVVAAAKAANCHALVYLSTYNVCYGGEPIEDGDENLPIFDPERHTDYYSRSKAWAEAVVTSADKAKCADGSALRTCVIRPAAIYGPGETRHFPRIVSHMEAGLFSLFSIGSPSSLVDWVHAEHVAQACRLALTQLRAGKEPPGGSVYFISDGSPINNFEFLRPLAEVLDAPFPRLAIPTPLAIRLARFAELLYHRYGIEPLLTQAEIYKVANTHYVHIDAARNDLGYRPAFTSIEGAQQMARHYTKHVDNTNFFRYAAFHTPVTALLITLGLAIHGIFAFEDVTTVSPFSWTSPLSILRAVAYLIFQTQLWIRIGFYCAILAHVVEALYACHIAQSMGCANWKRWGLQTLWLGYGSLRWLLARQRRWLVGRKRK